ncbi:hypothetical protein KAFR_0J01390 [Kazachstania africana CBS 2517]|uniref:25S rRNA (uridine-N(3))-methyltransferase BMT5-like domain-containing protein n=1 Tax=Kazachstania africana (strain ATCC 22294 / BCRC 22015 / CBS 2517 / CECT 1963 / NBRC 1671 / NRRL Y-8276) TaxID=1071382 RepID=H2B0Q6_KAZAF|nr:hypothetical protein KAFR_0J01390 [Kazachstania africana CBS 2517]CCF60206.1 hypothetical protein KAFR_0J01390 [Kazachstania africana CBS 2517]
MARKLKGKATATGLKAALLRHKLEAKSLRKKIQKEQVKPQKKPKHQQNHNQNIKFIPFNKEETLLLVGEGDFSFAKSIVEEEYIKPENLVVTSYDASTTELKLKYPNSFESNYNYLIEQGVKIFFKIDATKLVRTFKISKHTPWLKIMGNSWKFKYLDNIMFNFPHTGKGIKDQDRNIKDHQELVFGFFDSAKQFFKLINGKTKSSKSNHTQGYSMEENDKSNHISEEGYGNIILSLFDGEPYDSWQVKILAKQNQLQVERSNKFQWANYPSYHHKRTNNEQDTTKPARDRDARVYIFKNFEKKKHQVSKKNESDSE